MVGRGEKEEQDRLVAEAWGQGKGIVGTVPRQIGHRSGNRARETRQKAWRDTRDLQSPRRIRDSDSEEDLPHVQIGCDR